MDADLQQQVVAVALLVEPAHGLAHAQRRRHRAVRSRKRRHDGVADRLHDRPGLCGHDLVEHAEMLPDQIERSEIADPFVELGRALEVGEQGARHGVRVATAGCPMSIP